MTPSLIVLHYTAMASCAAARTRLCAPEHEVSAHWLISQTGEAEQLVDEAMRAWHAGAGSWCGQDDINSHSIGIELANTGAQPFAEPQMAALEHLLREIMARWSIDRTAVIGHSDMAPERKSDPGARFDWCRLARAGLSVWPDDPGDPSRPLADSLARIGYPAVAQVAMLTAFRLRFCPWVTGEETAQDRTLAAAAAMAFTRHIQGLASPAPLA